MLNLLCCQHDFHSQTYMVIVYAPKFTRVISVLCVFNYGRIYQKYDFLHKGSLNYKEFLQRLGVAVEKTANGGAPGTNYFLHVT